MIQQTKKTASSITEIGEGGLYCDSVSFSADDACFDKGFSITEEPNIKKLKLILKNRGSFTITNMSTDIKDADGIKSQVINLDSSGYKLLEAGAASAQFPLVVKIPADSISLIPVIHPEDKDAVCSEKKVLLTDNDLLSNIKDCCTGVVGEDTATCVTLQ